MGCLEHDKSPLNPPKGDLKFWIHFKILISLATDLLIFLFSPRIHEAPYDERGSYLLRTNVPKDRDRFPINRDKLSLKRTNKSACYNYWITWNIECQKLSGLKDGKICEIVSPLNPPEGGRLKHTNFRNFGTSTWRGKLKRTNKSTCNNYWIT